MDFCPFFIDGDVSALAVDPSAGVEILNASCAAARPRGVRKKCAQLCLVCIAERAVATLAERRSHRVFSRRVTHERLFLCRAFAFVKNHSPSG